MDVWLLVLSLQKDSWGIVRGVIIYVLIGISIGAAIHGFVPEGFFSGALGSGKWWTVPPGGYYAQEGYDMETHRHLLRNGYSVHHPQRLDFQHHPILVLAIFIGVAKLLLSETSLRGTIRGELIGFTLINRDKMIIDILKRIAQFEF